MFINFLRLKYGRRFQAILIILCTLYAAGSNAQTNLVFGVYTADKPTTMVMAFRPVLSALERDLSEKLQDNVSIKLQVASSYQKGINALVTGEVDFAMLGPASYVETLELQPDLRILGLDSKDGTKTFDGVICVREDSDITEISQIKGKRFAFGNERSTIGRFLSQALLTRHGVTAEFLQSYDYLGRHDRVAHSVAQGSHDAGALKEGTYKKLKKKGLKLRKLATIPLVNRPWVASAELEENLFVALKESMLNLDAPKAFKAMDRKQFVEGTDEDFAEIRAAINDNSDFFATKVKRYPMASTEE